MVLCLLCRYLNSLEWKAKNRASLLVGCCFGHGGGREGGGGGGCKIIDFQSLSECLSYK